MYRRSIMMEQERQDSEQFISRLGNLPIVSSAWGTVCTAYQKTKESHTLLKSTCDLAESGVQSVVSTAMPYVEKYQPQIEKVNAYACDKLTVMEEQYPVITRPTEDVLQEGKEKCANMVKPITDRVTAVKDTYTGVVNRGHEAVEATKGRVEAVKDYGMTTAARTLETPLGQYAMDKVNDALTLSEDYIEKYLPAGDDENADKVPEELDEVSTMTRVTALSSKLRQRMYKRAMRDLKGLQIRSQEKIEKLNFTVDLIEYAKSGAGDVKESLEEKYEVAQQRLAEYWDQVTAEEDSDDEEETPTTMEGRTIVMARQLTRQVRKGVTTVSGYMPVRLQPAVIRERLENAVKYSEELYQSFRKAESFTELPSWVVSQTRERLAYVQETVSFLADTFLVTPITWLDSQSLEITLNEVSKRAVEGPEPVPEAMEMEPVGGRAKPTRGQEGSDEEEE
ncbi:perilipin-2-like isoform X1 [Mya arenaria]|uniref:perilipin-2-like isoform X1 n=1 Tax=Mya arenaria TaxID=6604 RepID=UPI0022E1393F|nr:perilipin-2-like isoform X1 [Mya arenaria]